LSISEHAPLLQGLLAIAWADRVLKDEEKAFFGPLLEDLEIEVSPADLEAWLGIPPDPVAVPPLIADETDRRFILRQALQLAHEDGEYAPEERKLVTDWAAAWSITAAELSDIEQDVKERLAQRKASLATFSEGAAR
jgi:DnaJ-domain-containing protein 1